MKNAFLFFFLLIAICALAMAAPSSGRAPSVLFDEGHGQKFVTERKEALDLSGLAGVFRSRGAAVRAVHEPLAASTLKGADALVVSGAFAPLTPAEADAILGFLDRGGRVAIMLHIGQPVADLLHRLGVSISNGVIREQEGILEKDPMNFRATRFEPHPVTKGLKEFSVRGGWALLPAAPGVKAIASTSPRAWIDLNQDGVREEKDAMQAFALVVVGERGAGRFVVFCDDAIFQNQFLSGGNRRLAENLAGWLVESAGAAPQQRASAPLPEQASAPLLASRASGPSVAGE